MVILPLLWTVTFGPGDHWVHAAKEMVSVNKVSMIIQYQLLVDAPQICDDWAYI